MENNERQSNGGGRLTRQGLLAVEMWEAVGVVGTPPYINNKKQEPHKKHCVTFNSTLSANQYHEMFAMF